VSFGFTSLFRRRVSIKSQFSHFSSASPYLSPLWGEAGYIRLKRVNPSTLDDPDSDCGMDVTPADGTACTKDKGGNDVTPPAAKICGTSGILFATAIPVGGHLL